LEKRQTRGCERSRSRASRLQPDRLWAADVTQIRTGEGWLYLAAVLDLWSRKVVGWSMGAAVNADLVSDALLMAFERRRPDRRVVHHSDRGAAYTSLVTLASPVRSRIEFYSDPEADSIIEWTAAQPGLRWQVGRVLLLTLRYSGLRAGELVSLRTEEVDLDDRRISLVGKGRKPRVIPIPHLLADVLREYLEELRPKLPASPYLFANPRGNWSLHGRYGPRALHNLVVEAGTSAGVAGRHFAHRWRHTYATSLVRRGEDIHVVQRLMGHSNNANVPWSAVSRYNAA
jgi:integrase